MIMVLFCGLKTRPVSSGSWFKRFGMCPWYITSPMIALAYPHPYVSCRCVFDVGSRGVVLVGRILVLLCLGLSSRMCSF